MARAISSLPLPVGPCRMTGRSLRASRDSSRISQGDIRRLATPEDKDFLVQFKGPPSFRSSANHNAQAVCVAIDGIGGPIPTSLKRQCTSIFREGTHRRSI